jgi:DNA-directed RNA polymerase specialized sigma24 family protein
LEHIAWIADCHPALLARAVKLSGGNLHAGEDLLQDTLIRWLETPPRAKSALKLKHWLGTVMRGTFVDRLRRGSDEDLVLVGARELQVTDVADDDY